jgi:hypothetical protein
MSPSCNWTRLSCNKGGCILYTECTQVHYSKTVYIYIVYLYSIPWVWNIIPYPTPASYLLPGATSAPGLVSPPVLPRTLPPLVWVFSLFLPTFRWILCASFFSSSPEQTLCPPPLPPPSAPTCRMPVTPSRRRRSRPHTRLLRPLPSRIGG